MKLFQIILIALLFCACGKDYVCECTNDSIGVIETSQMHGSEKKARKKCDEKSGNIIGQPGNVTIPVKCTLK